MPLILQKTFEYWNQDTLLNKFINKIFVLILLPISTTVFFLVIFLRPFIQIRFALLPDIRIGHFALDLSLYIKEKEKLKNKKRILDIFCFSHKNYLANSFLKKKWKQKLIIFPRFIIAPVIRILDFFFTFLPFKNIHKIPIKSFDKKNLILNSKKIFSFTKDEVTKGKEILYKMGILDMKKIIVLIIRDSSYLKKTQPDKNWSYHNYRDIELNKFVDLVKFLVKKKYYVVRMGKIVSQPFPFKHKFFIDYPYSKFKSDFLDIFICANSFFTISTLTGLDSVSYIYKRPILGIQFPIHSINILNHCKLITLPKFFSKKKKDFLKVSELIKIIKSESALIEEKGPELTDSKILKKHHLTMVGNTKKEIKNAGKDMLKILNTSHTNNQNQKKFWKQMINLYDCDLRKILKKKIGTIKTRISLSYYKKNRKYLEY